VSSPAAVHSAVPTLPRGSACLHTHHPVFHQPCRSSSAFLPSSSSRSIYSMTSGRIACEHHAQQLHSSLQVQSMTPACRSRRAPPDFSRDAGARGGVGLQPENAARPLDRTIDLKTSIGECIPCNRGAFWGSVVEACIRP